MRLRPCEKSEHILTTFLMSIAAAGAINAASAISTASLPEEIRNLTPAHLTKPAQTVLSLGPARQWLGDSAVVVIWMKYKPAGKNDKKDAAVVFESEKLPELEWQATEAFFTAVLDVPQDSGYVPGDWLYHEIVFRKLPSDTLPLEYENGFLRQDSALTRVDIYPEMTYQEPPRYPWNAKRAGTEGIVWIKSLVGEHGNIRMSLIGKSSGDSTLDAAALEASYKNKYKPALQDGKPVSCWVTYKVQFKLAD